ncbi:MAG: hypothetical protein ACXAC5_00925 [Promethearchaeota archaeon]
MKRKYLPSLVELVDRLSIHQLKEVFIPEHKDKYQREMRDIMDDMNLIIKEDKIELSAELIRAVVVIAQINEHIWYNESKVRSGESQDLGLLKLTHGLNGIRNRTMNYFLSLIGDEGRRDWKTDCLAAEFSDWEILLDLVREDEDDSE